MLPLNVSRNPPMQLRGMRMSHNAKMSLNLRGLLVTVKWSLQVTGPDVGMNVKKSEWSSWKRNGI